MSAVIPQLIVIGAGLIGSSLAASAKRAGLCERVLAVVRRDDTGKRALELGVADAYRLDIKGLRDQFNDGDVIFIAVPTLSVRSILAELSDIVPETVTITDGASVKGSVRDDVLAVYGRMPPNIVLGHPIAGSERSGVEAVNPDLYIDHRIIITPDANTDAVHLERVQNLWRGVGGDVVTMAVELHDEVLAATSHLPHAIAYSLVDTLAHDSLNENIFRYAAGGFRDFTRIASSDAIMWRDIMLANKPAVLSAIDLFLDNLGRLRALIETDNATELTGVFTRAKAARDRFTLMLTHRAYSTSMTTQSSSTNPTFIASPGGRVAGSIRVPGDKSISHRSIMLGSLAEGTTHIEGFLEGEDALATLQTFRDMGVVIEGPDVGKVTVHGVGLHGLKAPAGPLYVGNSGTSMRLLSGILAAQSFDTELSGDESLTKRPMNRVAKPLAQMGALIETAEEGRPPLKIKGGCSLTGIDYVMPMASAQVKSCLLLAGLYAYGSTSVTEPAPTRDHTERMLRGFGYDVEREGQTITVRSGAKLSACAIDIPADISSAAFFLVAASITPGADLTLTHVGINPTRTGVINILKLMGADIELLNEREVGGEPVADLRVRYATLKGIEVPVDQVPLAIDEFPALCIAAACAEGRTVVTGAEELRVKETDRIQAMADGLVTLGITCEVLDDGIVVHGGSIGGGDIESFGDHRIAMSFAIASLRACAPIRIRNCANVATSFPNFVELAREVGLRLDLASN